MGPIDQAGPPVVDGVAVDRAEEDAAILQRVVPVALPKALTIRLPWMLSWRRFVRVPVVTCPRLVNRLIFLVIRRIGKIDAGKTIEAITAKTQSFRKTTTIKTIRDIASRMREATESVSAARTKATSLLTREMRVPVGWR